MIVGACTGFPVRKCIVALPVEGFAHGIRHCAGPDTHVAQAWHVYGTASLHVESHAQLFLKGVKHMCTCLCTGFEEVCEANQVGTSALRSTQSRNVLRVHEGLATGAWAQKGCEASQHAQRE